MYRGINSTGIWSFLFLNPGGYADFPQPPWHRLPELDVGQRSVTSRTWSLARPPGCRKSLIGRGELSKISIVMYANQNMNFRNFLIDFLHCFLLLRAKIYFYINGCQTKSICLIMMIFNPKEQYTILFQWNFISGVYLLQEKSYLTFHTGQDFWRALYNSITHYQFFLHVRAIKAITFRSDNG